MKTTSLIQYLLTASLMLGGTLTHAKEKPEQQRGWIGGNYERTKYSRSTSEYFFGAAHTHFTFPLALTNSQTAGFLLTSLATNTPAWLAGLREGDLILGLGDQPMTDWPAFSQTITRTPPGEPLRVKAWRAGKIVECQVTVGREKYRPLGYFSIGLPGYYSRLHPVPTSEAPSCSLIALGYEQLPGPQVELGSVEKQFEQACHPKGKATGFNPDWRCWLVIFEVKKGKEVLAQEVVPALEKKTL